MPQYTFFPDLTETVPDIPPDSIVSRTIHSDDDVKVVMFGFATGQELSEHTAAMPASLLFLKGNAALILGEETQDAHAGTWVHMPPKLPHSIVAHTPVIMLLILFRSAANKA